MKTRRLVSALALGMGLALALSMALVAGRSARPAPRPTVRGELSLAPLEQEDMKLVGADAAFYWRILPIKPSDQQADAAAAAQPGGGNGSLTPPGDLPADAWNKILAQLHRSEYGLAPASGAYQAPNRAHNLRVIFDQHGIHVTPSPASVETGEGLTGTRNWKLNLALTGYGHAGNLQPTSTDPVQSANGNQLTYHWNDSLTEWYVNDERGLEQGFALALPPTPTQRAGKGEDLVLEMALDTSLIPEFTDDSQAIRFTDAAGNTVLRYGELHATDATGRELPAHLELTTRPTPRNTQYALRIAVDDSNTVYPIAIDPLLTSYTTKLLASDAAVNDAFGWSVAVSGDTIVVGAQGDGTDLSSAYVFARNQGGADAWGQVKKITVTDGEADDFFGCDVAISGDTVVVGAWGDDDNGWDSGSAYVFQRNQGGADNWGQTAKITASDGVTDAFFGVAVDVSGDTVVVGAYGDDDHGPYSGSAYVFECNRGGADNWGQTAKITAADGAVTDCFGYAVSISGDTVVVGAHGDDDNGSDSGSAYVFTRSQGGADNWGQTAKIAAADGAADDEFGYAVSISGDVVVVGAHIGDGLVADAGSVYVFERNQGGADAWGQAAKITAPDGAADDEFGYAVGIRGNTVVVGAPKDDDKGWASGSAYVFERNQGGADAWGQTAKVVAPDGVVYDGFGWSVAIGGSTVVVGVPLDDDYGNASGSAYTFARMGNTWVRENKPIATDGATDDEFGLALAVSGDTAIVGAYYDDDNGSYSGSAYVFARNQGGANAWGQVTKITATDGATDDYFGIAVAVSGDILVVGAYGDDDNGPGSGSAYVFQRNQGVADAWGQTAKITATDGVAGDEFGFAVSVSGDTLVVGAHYDGDNGAYSGSAYVFERNHGGPDAWGQVTRIAATDGVTNDGFGYAVGISGDTVVVGAPGDDDNGPGSGSAYVFQRNQGEADAWGQVTKITATDGANDDQFGYAVAIGEDTVVVGAHQDDDNGVDSGSAYVFQRNQGGADAWGQTAKITADDGAATDFFGVVVAISGDIVVVGAPCDDDNGDASGSAYVFQHNRGGANNWGQTAKITAGDGAALDGFGYAVSVSENTIVAGAHAGDGAATDSGAAYVYRWTYLPEYHLYLPLVVRNR
jgi:hypothetical protein